MNLALSCEIVESSRLLLRPRRGSGRLCRGTEPSRPEDRSWSYGTHLCRIAFFRWNSAGLYSDYARNPTFLTSRFGIHCADHRDVSRPLGLSLGRHHSGYSVLLLLRGRRHGIYRRALHSGKAGHGLWGKPFVRTFLAGGVTVRVSRPWRKFGPPRQWVDPVVCGLALSQQKNSGLSIWAIRHSRSTQRNNLPLERGECRSPVKHILATLFIGRSARSFLVGRAEAGWDDAVEPFVSGFDPVVIGSPPCSTLFRDSLQGDAAPLALARFTLLVQMAESHSPKIRSHYNMTYDDLCKLRVGILSVGS